MISNFFHLVIAKIPTSVNLQQITEQCFLAERLSDVASYWMVSVIDISARAILGLIIKRKSGEIPCPLAVEAFAAHLSYICKYDDKYSKWVWLIKFYNKPLGHSTL